MSFLPKIEHPLTPLTLPISKKKVFIRPMTVKDEKILMLASESKADRIFALKQVVTNCTTALDFDVEKIPFVDFEFLFLMLRAISIDNQVQVEVGKQMVLIDLREYKIKNTENIGKVTIKLNQKDLIVFSYPTVSTVLHLHDRPNYDLIHDMIAKCVDSIYIDNVVYTPESPEYNEGEVIDFIENQPRKILTEINDKLFIKAPYIYYVVNIDGKDTEVTDFSDFF